MESKMCGNWNTFKNTFYSVLLVSILLIVPESGKAQWYAACGAGPSCTNGTGMSQTENCGTVTPTTNRQLITKSVGGSPHKIFWSFTATAGRTYVFDLCSMGSGLGGLTSNRIVIYDGPCSSGDEVGHSGYSDICNLNGYVEWTCTASGTYYVRPFYSSDCTGNFSAGTDVSMGYYYFDMSSCSTATGNYFDAGGNGGSGTSQGVSNFNYFKDITGIVRTYTPSSGYVYSATFSSFATQSANDYLYVYNGNSTASPQVTGSPFSGGTLPNGGAPITSTAVDGSLTFEFVSNSNFVVGAGYLASLTTTIAPASAPVISGGTLTCLAPTTTLTVTNPIGGTTYSWAGPVTGTGTSLANATAGSYTVTGTNASGCTAIGTYNLAAAPTPPTASISPAPSGVITCTNTSLTLGTTTNAVSPTYSWTGAGTGSGSSLVATAAGTYNVLITSSNGCSNTASVVITSNTTAPGASIAPASTITCTTPSITLAGSSATGGVSYAWTGAGTGSSANLSTSTAGSYTLTVTNPVNGCTSTANVTVTANTTAPGASIAPASTITCTTPSITLNGSSATGGVSYAWTGAGTGSSANLSTSTAGSYTLTVTNPVNGCTSTANVTVTANTTAPGATIAPASIITCTTPSITLNGSSATGGVSYAWTGAGTGSSANLSTSTAGSYTLTVTNPVNGCTSTANVIVTANTTAPGATIAPPATINCTSPSITLNGSSATGGVSYAWTGAGTGSSANLSTSTAGSYTLTVTNPVNGCTSTANTTVTSNTTAPGASIAPASIITCTSPSITLNGSSATGGVSYAWTGAGTGSSANLSTSTAGSYTLTVTNPVNGCTSTANVTVTANTTAPGASIAPASTITCTTPSITLNGSSATGGVSYAWTGAGTGSSANLSTSTAGSYTLTVTNPVNGCTSTANVTVTANTTAPGATIAPASIITCTTPSITLNGSSATGGVTYAWTGAGTGSSANLSTSIAGSYTLTVTNPVNGCTSTANVTVTANTTVPNVSIDPVATINCAVTSVTLTGSSSTSGVTYAWTGPTTGSSATLTTSTAGSYTLTVTDPANGCTNAASITVNSNTTTPDISVSPANDITCSVPSVVLTGSSTTAGVNYAWTEQGSGNPAGTTPSAATTTVSAAGTYVLTVSDPTNGCTNSSTVTVNGNASAPDISTQTSVDITCTNLTSTLSGSSTTPGATYAWTDVSSNPAGTSPTSTSSDVTTPGTYVLTVTDPSTGCVAQQQVIVADNTTPPTVTVNSSSTSVDCLTNLTASLEAIVGGNSAQWSGPSGSIAGNPISVSTGGTYTVVVTDASNGCTASEDVIIAGNNIAPAMTVTIDQTICPSETATLIATGGGIYLWSTGETTSSIAVSPIADQYYSVVVTNSFGCTSEDSSLVTIYTSAGLLNANLDSTNTDESESVTVDVVLNDSGNTGIVTIVSNPTNGTVVVNGTDITYTPNAGFIGTDTLIYQTCDAFCTSYCDTAYMIIRVEANIPLFIPSGFSPNGDGLNDVFVILGLDEFPENELFIFNRWGELVYSKKPYLNDWGGESNNDKLKLTGDEVVDGTYFYVLKLTPDDEGYNGYIELRRR